MPPKALQRLHSHSMQVSFTQQDPVLPFPNRGHSNPVVPVVPVVTVVPVVAVVPDVNPGHPYGGGQICLN